MIIFQNSSIVQLNKTDKLEMWYWCVLFNHEQNRNVCVFHLLVVAVYLVFAFQRCEDGELPNSSEPLSASIDDSFSRKRKHDDESDVTQSS